MQVGKLYRADSDIYIFDSGKTNHIQQDSIIFLYKIEGNTHYFLNKDGQKIITYNYDLDVFTEM